MTWKSALASGSVGDLETFRTMDIIELKFFILTMPNS
jgi:hypothetical protein